MWQSKMDNPEKLTQGTQDEEKHNKNTTHYVLDTNILKQRTNWEEEIKNVQT